MGGAGAFGAPAGAGPGGGAGYGGGCESVRACGADTPMASGSCWAAEGAAANLLPRLSSFTRRCACLMHT